MKKIVTFAKPYTRYVFLAAFASIVSAFTNIWVIELFKVLVDETISGGISNIGMVIAEAVTAIASGIAANYFMRYATEYFGASVLNDLRKQTMNHITSMSPDYIEKNNFGDIITRMTSEMEGISGYMEEYLKDWVYLPFMILVYSVYLFSSNVVLTAACIAPLFILVPLSIVKMKPIKLDQKKYTIELGMTNNNIKEVCDGIDVIKSYNLENAVEDKYYNALHKTLVTSNRNDIRQYNMEPISVMIGILPVGISLCLGGFMVFTGGITLGILVAFVNTIKKYVTPLQSVYAMIVKGQVAMIGVQRILEILDAPIEQQSYEDVLETDNEAEYQFSLKNVSFAYAGRENGGYALENICLDIEKGKKTAFVGRSGGGKSTLLKILYRHYEINKGEIYCCGQSYNDIVPNVLRDSISLISQESYLFPMSIADNIRIGCANATDEDIQRAARLANCEEFILNMPQGYDSLVGEKGTFLSGGQKQRISIARAILKDAPVILLDEPTSALDMESEEYVNEALDRITRGRTVVIVAHRLTTIMNADKIVVVDEGRIVAQGTHENLMGENGLYSQLFREYYGERREDSEK